MKTTVAIFVFVASFARAESLEAVLTRMDQSAQQFRSLSAKTKRIQYTAVLNDSSQMDGVLRIKRGNKGGVIGIIEFSQPDPRTFYLNGKTAEIFYPKANTVEIYDTSKFAANIDQFLLIGFGTTSAELKKSYDIKAAGTEQISGMPATRLELTPKTAELKKMITKLELWIPEGQSNPIQEKVTEPSKNYELVNYSDIKLNPSIPDGDFELKLPAGVKKIYPQK